MKCQKCGQEIEEGSEYCQHCGYKVEEIPKGPKTCPQCGHVVEEGVEFCPQCGCYIQTHEQKEKCPYCGKEVSSSDSFCLHCGQPLHHYGVHCPQCGASVHKDDSFCLKCGYPLNGQTPQPQNKTCPKCGTPVTDAEKYCPVCGQYVGGQTQASPNNDYPYVQHNDEPSKQWQKPVEPSFDEKIDHEAIKNDQYKGYWKKPILWVVSIALIICAYAGVQYIKGHQIALSSSTSSSSVEMKMTGETNHYTQQTNITLSGGTYLYKDTFYFIEDETLYKIENTEKGLDYSKKTKVLDDEVVGYISVDDDYVYYCDDDYNYYRYHLNDKEDEKLLENIYYVNKIGDQIYYQNDTDNESIHIYNLSSKEDKTVNKEKSYGLMIDQENKHIFYLNGDSASSTSFDLKVINEDGTSLITLVKDVDGGTLVIDDQKLYFSKNQAIYTLDMTSIKENMESQKFIESDNNCFNLYDDGFVYSHDNALYWCNKEGQKSKKIYNREAYIPYVLGDKIVISSYDPSNTSKNIYIVLDKNGNNQTLSSSSSYSNDDDEKENQDIDGATDF